MLAQIAGLHLRALMSLKPYILVPLCKGVRRGGSKFKPPIGLSATMYNKENITFLAILSLFFLQWQGLQHDLK